MTILATLWKTLGLGGTAAVLLGLALAVSLWNADRISGQKGAAIEARIACETRHEITAASLEQSLAREQAMLEAGEARAEAARKAAEEQKEHSASLQRQIDRLRSTRPVAVDGECQSPDAVMSADGL